MGGRNGIADALECCLYLSRQDSVLSHPKKATKPRRVEKLKPARSMVQESEKSTIMNVHLGKSVLRRI